MIRNRNDILKEIEYGVRNRPYIQRALLDGKVEFLGGFKQIPPWSQPGWIVKLTSTHNRIWYIAIIPAQNGYLIMCRVLDDGIPWDQWDGDKSNNPLYQGDNPDEYRRLKDGQTKK